MDATGAGVTLGPLPLLETDFSSGSIRNADLDLAMRPFDLPPAIRKAFLSTLRRYVSDTFAVTGKVDAHIIVGNPPWIGWDGLTRRYRDHLGPLWAASSLMVNTGWRAKVAAGKTEFSSLFVYRAADRHAAENAVMAFVLPLSLFQSHLSGAGFRTFRTAGGRRGSRSAPRTTGAPGREKAPSDGRHLVLHAPLTVWSADAGRRCGDGPRAGRRTWTVRTCARSSLDPSAGVSSARLRDGADGACAMQEPEPARNATFTVAEQASGAQIPKRTKCTSEVQSFWIRTRAPGYGACRIMPLPA